METKIIKLFHIGVGGEKGRVYSPDGVMATIPATCYTDPPKILVDTNRVVKLNDGEFNNGNTDDKSTSHRSE